MEKETIKDGARLLLGAALIFAGISHLSFARKEFRAQVPNWIPLKKDDTVIYSGFAEIALGVALIAVPKKQRATMGKITAGFFAAVFPGNIAQYTHHRTAFGLNSDNQRLARLAFQPLLITWALASTNQNKKQLHKPL